MYCRNCGKEVDDNAIVCVHCGVPIINDRAVTSWYDQPKTGVGALLCIFLGLIGLLIGVLMYPPGTISRETFTKGWLDVLIAKIVLVFIIFLITFIFIICAM